MKFEGHIVEVEIAWADTCAEDLLRIIDDEYSVETRCTHPDCNWSFKYATIETLYELKMSHRYLKNSPHFIKTMQDIKNIRQNFPDVQIVHKEWYNQREKETYTYKHPNLDSMKNDFFKDESFYKYDHDDIHKAIALGEYPAYMDIVSEGAQVKCDRNKWETISYERKLQCALEESYVLTLERGLIPNNFKPDPYVMFQVAVMKVCSSITSGWFREWCWENYDEIMKNYSEDFVTNFNNSLNAGLIRLFKSEVYA